MPLLDRHRTAVLLNDKPVADVVRALGGYHNRDGGFEHALEPDVRGPESEPGTVLHALEVLAELGALDNEMVVAAAEWVASIASPGGGVPLVMPAATIYPHAQRAVTKDPLLASRRCREWSWLHRNGWRLRI